MNENTINELIKKLDEKQINEVIEIIFKLNNSQENISFKSLPKEYSQLLKFYNKMTAREKHRFLVIIMDYVINELEVIEWNKNKLLDTQKNLENNFNEAININKQNIKRRYSKIPYSDNIRLFNYFELAIKGSRLLSVVPLEFQEIVFAFKNSDSINRIKVLEFIKEQLQLEKKDLEAVMFFSDEIDELITEIKKENIVEIIEDSKKLDEYYQRKFIKEAHEKIVSLYERLSKENRMKNCFHEFGEWKNESYSTMEKGVIDHQYVTLPVEHTLYVRKCIKCGYEEKIDYIPEEVIEKRKKAEKDRKIKQLKRRLQKLENKE